MVMYSVPFEYVPNIVIYCTILFNSALTVPSQMLNGHNCHTEFNQVLKTFSKSKNGGNTNLSLVTSE